MSDRLLVAILCLWFPVLLAVNWAGNWAYNELTEPEAPYCDAGCEVQRQQLLDRIVNEANQKRANFDVNRFIQETLDED